MAKTAGVIVAIIIVVLLLLAYAPTLQRTVINPPRPNVVMLDGDDYFKGLDYRFKVTCTVRNDGGDGSILVTVYLSSPGRYEEQEKTIYIRSGESRDLMFDFDISFWKIGSVQYRVEARPV